MYSSDAVDVKLTISNYILQIIKKYLVKKKEHANKDTASEMMLFHCACIELDRNISCFSFEVIDHME